MHASSFPQASFIHALSPQTYNFHTHAFPSHVPSPHMHSEGMFQWQNWHTRSSLHYANNWACPWLSGQHSSRVGAQQPIPRPATHTLRHNLLRRVHVIVSRGAHGGGGGRFHVRGIGPRRVCTGVHKPVEEAEGPQGGLWGGFVRLHQGSRTEIPWLRQRDLGMSPSQRPSLISP